MRSSRHRRARLRGVVPSRSTAPPRRSGRRPPPSRGGRARLRPGGRGAPGPRRAPPAAGQRAERVITERHAPPGPRRHVHEEEGLLQVRGLPSERSAIARTSSRSSAEAPRSRSRIISSACRRASGDVDPDVRFLPDAPVGAALVELGARGAHHAERQLLGVRRAFDGSSVASSAHCRSSHDHHRRPLEREGDGEQHERGGDPAPRQHAVARRVARAGPAAGRAPRIAASRARILEVAPPLGLDREGDGSSSSSSYRAALLPAPLTVELIGPRSGTDDAGSRWADALPSAAASGLARRRVSARRGRGARRAAGSSAVGRGAACAG